jgi:hypothetical protein
MALNAPALAALIQAKIIANPAVGGIPGPGLDGLCNAIAQAVVEHITSSASLTVVTACPAGAGTGTGTVG